VRSLATWRDFGAGWKRRIEGVQVKAHAMSHPAGHRTVSDAAIKPASEKARSADIKATAKPGVKPAAVATGRRGGRGRDGGGAAALQGAV